VDVVLKKITFMKYLSLFSASKFITFKKNAVLLVVTMICFIGVNAQDILTKKTGEDIKAKVLEVTTNEIKYKLFDNLNGPTFVVLKSDLIMLRYENGTKDIYNQTNKANQASASSNMNDDEMSEKGKNDAKVSYTGKNSGAGWTSATTLIMAPLSGAVVAFLCSNESPSDENLNISNKELMKNQYYKAAYTEEAHKIKKKKLWKSFGISAAVWVGLVVLGSSL